PRRDADRELPREELAALARSGLLAIGIPTELGGAGLPPSAVAAVFAILAEADVALAQIGQNHFDFVDVLRFAAEPFRGEMLERIGAGTRLGNALAERGVKDMTKLRTRLSEADGGYRLDGVKHFATGALTAEWIPVIALDPSDQILVAYVERDSEGLTTVDDWDAFGQRATHSGTVNFDAVFVPAERVVRRGEGDAALAVGLLAGNQLIHTAIEYGGAVGAAAARRETGAAPDARQERDLELARLALARAGRLVDAAVLDGPADRDRSVRAMAAVDGAKAITYRVGPRAAASIFDADGIEAVLGDARLDRWWRNSRVHSLHDPARLRARDVGAYLLFGEPPTMAAGLLRG
ncbi:MAG TPA: acyl-CoA dehydrogenase family protein, partial [Solirubrobacterales bacterium]|nr:acyl-CoA dehydrogenase family protein [Solirubrobacterales bacterium]